MSDKLQEPLIKFLNREAVASQSPGLPRFGGYPGERTDNRSNPNGVAPTGRYTNKSRVKRTRRNLFEVGNLYRSIPRVAAKARQPWALGRNRFAVKKLNQSFLQFVVSSNSGF